MFVCPGQKLAGQRPLNGSDGTFTRMQNGVPASMSTEAYCAEPPMCSLRCRAGVGVGSHTYGSTNGVDQLTSQSTRQIRAIIFVVGREGYGLHWTAEIAQRNILWVNERRHTDMSVYGRGSNVYLV